jgi:hypothetical protein
MDQPPPSSSPPPGSPSSITHPCPLSSDAAATLAPRAETAPTSFVLLELPTDTLASTTQQQQQQQQQQQRWRRRITLAPGEHLLGAGALTGITVRRSPVNLHPPVTIISRHTRVLIGAAACRSSTRASPHRYRPGRCRRPSRVCRYSPRLNQQSGAGPERVCTPLSRRPAVSSKRPSSAIYCAHLWQAWNICTFSTARAGQATQ